MLAKAVGGVTTVVRSLGRGLASGIAVVAMVVIYAVSSISSYGVAALGLTGVTGLALATSAQPAQARRRCSHATRDGSVSLRVISASSASKRERSTHRSADTKRC